LLLAASAGCAGERYCEDMETSSLAVTFEDASTGDRLCPEVQMALDGGPMNGQLLTAQCVLVGPWETVGTFDVTATLSGYEPLHAEIKVGEDECGMVPEARTLRMQPLAGGDAR
jgi:hypothetical protein